MSTTHSLLVKWIDNRLIRYGFDPRQLLNERFLPTGEGTEEVELLASAALVGHLSGMTANGVNIVNATVLARERGVTWNARHTTRDEVGSLETTEI